MMNRLSSLAQPYDAAWRKLRRQHLARQPTCVRCGALGQHIHHKVTVKKAPHRRLDPTNLETLCQPCHNRVTMWHERLGPRGSAIDGTPLAPDHPWNRGGG